MVLPIMESHTLATLSIVVEAVQNRLLQNGYFSETRLFPHGNAALLAQNGLTLQHDYSIVAEL
jgi:hypothetical protein